MSKELISKYKQDVQKIRNSAKECNLTDAQINKLFEDCFLYMKDVNNELTYNVRNEKSTFLRTLLLIFKYIFIFLIVTIIVFIVLHNHQPTFSLVLRNVQDFIYPGLKLLRILAIPVITLFPDLSQLYDETCLIENPYFQVVNMECWPCENVNSVLNSTKSFNPNSYQTGIPYVTKSLDKNVSFSTLKDLYINNSKTFNEDSFKLISNYKNYTKVEDLLKFEPTERKDTHILWRINRMLPARILRTIFPRPKIVSPWSGQSTERYLIIDEAKADPYIFPSPECSYVLLTQGTGERTIILKPSQECSGQCKTISTVLKPKYSLWYNWWYWRPISLPSENSTDISITYLSSYC